MREKRGEPEKVEKGSEKLVEERKSKDRRSISCCLVTLSTVHRNLQQACTFAAGTGLTNDTADLEKHD